MSFLIYDISFLVIFVLFVFLFLYKNKKNVKKDGWLLLYRASWGIKLINKVGKNFPKTLRVLGAISVISGYALMTGVLYFFGKIMYIYIAFPDVVRAVKVPPILPLFPYLPDVFGLDFLPTFNFTYWIIIIAIIAITHEFAHGIFAAREKIKIKSTGFGFFPFFFPVFLAAFVEPDEKSMQKSKIFPQLEILSAGTFANLITAIITGFLMIGVFSVAFVPSGVIFNDYAYAPVSLADITQINNITITNQNTTQALSYISSNLSNKIITTTGNYVALKGISQDQAMIYLYNDAPAINAKLQGVIIYADGIKTNTPDELINYVMENKSVGSQLNITALVSGEQENFTLILGDNPYSPGTPWMGIVFSESSSSGIIGTISSLILQYKDAHTYYVSTNDFGLFIYNLLWWLFLISISVALVNMLPVGIFDGGRFFYLTLFAITKNKKFSERVFKIVTALFLLSILILMAFWVLSFFNI